MHLEHVNLSLKGWNWGLAKFTANALDFEVDGKPAFEVPLCNVSHSMTGKNEVTLEFHPNDDAPVSLMELRFHIPADANVDDPVQVFIDEKIISIVLVSSGFPAGQLLFGWGRLHQKSSVIHPP